MIGCNMKIVIYLNITFNLNEDIYRPYQKLDYIIQYIHVECVHPSLSKFSKKKKNVSPNSLVMEKYSMNQYPSMKINYNSLVASESESINQL